MKKLLVATVAVTALVAPQIAGAATLAQRVAKLEAKANCLVRYGLSEWNGYAAYVGGDGLYAYDGGEGPAANLDLVFGDTSPPHVWVVAVRNTDTCRARFARGVNPFGFVARPAHENAKLRKLAVG